jgi:hypothetical protein
MRTKTICVVDDLDECSYLARCFCISIGAGNQRGYNASCIVHDNIYDYSNILEAKRFFEP